MESPESQPGQGHSDEDQKTGNHMNGDAVNDAPALEDVPSDSRPPTLKSHEKVLLHGSLDVWLYEAKDLTNPATFLEKIRRLFSFCDVCRGPRPADATPSHHRGIVNKSDPYAAVVLGGSRVARTRVVSNNLDPVWNEHFVIEVAHFVSEVVFNIKDDDFLGAESIGDVEIPAEVIARGDPVEGWYDIFLSGKKIRENSSLRLKITYFPVDLNPLYKNVVSAPPDYRGTPDTYFPLRKGSSVVLYHDAHVEDGTLPDVNLDNDQIFKRGKCFEEICTAILEAHHMVYIAGWSMYTQIKLIRDMHRKIPDGGNLTLGKLLKRKSQEGVRVLVLVWDDKTSHDKFGIKTEGVMAVHDEDTKKYFRRSAVRCVLAPRYADSKLSWVRQQVVGTLYAHHQKICIVDSQGPTNTRKLTAFLGGLDLCDGRYDTPGHPLFKESETTFKGDYHQPTFATGKDSGGPRQPWHDLHCKLDGPAAYDVLTNFEERWRKATRWHDDELIDIQRISWILGPSKETPPEGDPQLMVTDDEDPETWHAQVFRSIDSGSAKGFPQTASEAAKRNLEWRKNIAVEASIQTAYVRAIRGAQHFIYIENQYFIGSSYGWPDYKSAGADHLIPMEIALKVAKKIRAGERFAAYILIPLWPEGAPDSASVQEMLYFQGQTIQMMYTIVADAIREEGLSSHPREYLNFYCLGNRETDSDSDLTPENPPLPNSKQALVQKNRRFMIYIHSKGMIVDDEFIILGSANINQRSMDGSRDTEIAVGAYQPHHSWAQASKHPRGQIYGFRMGLWAEHLAFLDDSFNEPSSLECVHKVNEAAEKYWEQYVADEVTDLKGHLMRYPYHVTVDGQLTHLDGHERFPDLGGKIMGASSSIPDNLTT